MLETSLTLHDAPQAVAPCHRGLPPCPCFGSQRAIGWLVRGAAALGREALACELDYAARALPGFAVRPFLGYTGRPHLARCEVGAM